MALLWQVLSLPTYCIRTGKNNVTCVRRPNEEYNFFPLDANGQPDRDNGHWNEVMTGFLE